MLLVGSVAAQQFRSTQADGFERLDGVITSADLDGDGVADLVLGSGIRLTDGRGRPGPAIPLLTGPLGTGVTTAAVGDLDGDGDLDLVLASDYPLNPVWQIRNDGSGMFTDVTASQMPPNSGGTIELALIDVENDGDLDIYLGRADQDRLLLNDGSGRMADASSRLPAEVGFTGFEELEIGDLDADGDADLVLRQVIGLALRINDGTGRFTDRPGPVPTQFVQHVLLGDVDGDADLDLFVSGANQQAPPIELWRNDGTGMFAPASVLAPSGNGYGAALGDWNGDGALDLAMSVDGRLLVSITRPSGTTGPWLDMSFARGFGTGREPPLAVDLDGDLDLDLISGGRFFRNDGHGSFVDATRVNGIEPTDGNGPALDIDGDGDTDIVVPDRFLVNDGRGRFDRVEHSLRDRIHAAADMDGDGHIDLIGAYSNTQTGPSIWFGDGSLGFHRVQLPGFTVGNLEVGDFDQDGDIDLCVLAGVQFGLPYDTDYVLRNDGGRQFVLFRAWWLPPDLSSAWSDQGDFNQDGFVDLVISNGRGFLPQLPNAPQVRILLGQSGGRFFQGPVLPAAGDVASCVAFFDLGNDGDLDVFQGSAAPQIYENHAGTLTNITARMNLPSQLVRRPELLVGDFDGDGYDDVIHNGRYFRQDASGLLVEDFTRMPAGRLPHVPTQAADFDRDGDLDLFGNGDVLLNLDRQITAYRQPKAGRVFEVGISSQPGYGLGNQAGLLAASIGPASTPRLLGSWGLLMLDVRSASVLGFRWLPSTGRDRFAIPVPSDPILHGLELTLQGATLRVGSAGNRLTNTLEVRIE